MIPPYATRSTIGSQGSFARVEWFVRMLDGPSGETKKHWADWDRLPSTGDPAAAADNVRICRLTWSRGGGRELGDERARILR